jgi:hypothetical protein
MGGHWAAGLWRPVVTHYYLVFTPVALPAILLGLAVNHRLQGEGFLKYVYFGLAGIGVLLFLQSIRT